MYVGLHVSLSYMSDCQLFGMHCQRSLMLLLIIENCIGLSFSPIYLFIFFPLFYDQAKLVSMTRHSMDVVRKAVEIINPGQVSIITVDQPLYTLAKQIQWSWPDTYSENADVAYTCELTEDTNILSFNDWCSSTAKTCPMFTSGP